MDERMTDGQPSPKSDLFQDTPPGCTAEAHSLESIFGDERQARAGGASPAPRHTGDMAGFLEKTEQLLTPLTETLTEIGVEIKRIKTEQHVLTEMHDRCRELGEQHYQREILGPLFRCAIAIADRCHQQARTLQKILNKHASRDNKAAVEAIRYLLEARKADRIEVESMLANYGVESFENTEDRFDPGTQKCISKTDTSDADLAGRVSQRVLPGYRREDRVIRQEYVNVHVLKASPNHLSKGEEQ